MKSIDRRSFVKSSSVGLVGVSLFPLSSECGARWIGQRKTSLSAQPQMAVQREEHAWRHGTAFRRHALHARDDSAYEQDVAVAWV